MTKKEKNLKRHKIKEKKRKKLTKTRIDKYLKHRKRFYQTQMK